MHSHEEVIVLSRTNQFLFFVGWEDHFEGLHHLILPKVTSDHFPILVEVSEILLTKRFFKFENVAPGRSIFEHCEILLGN